jgi:hypothetical protein
VKAHEKSHYNRRGLYDLHRVNNPFLNLREEEMAETTRSDSDAARTIFYIAAISMAIFGAGLLLGDVHPE